VAGEKCISAHQRKASSAAAALAHGGGSAAPRGVSRKSVALAHRGMRHRREISAKISALIGYSTMAANSKKRPGGSGPRGGSCRFQKKWPAVQLWRTWL